ncbi:50S ribosomal protein L34e [Candidatus Woesearchaeota archaeon]|nr:50S ribosomal protein L34e [Candidatus Woesearchaeota archaeon]MBW3013733.1 50S ribosomal protein L34e [Candidatus Woesearchaeota archaeon]
MVEGKYRSRTYRRVKRKTPGSKTVSAFVRRKPKRAKCGSCGQYLKGVACQRIHKIKNMPKTAKRPTRTYGGVLCTKCTRLKLKAKARTGETK